MYLKSIEVQGFKSFANKMVFDFHEGITGIVGPNGSGKSNVADAVRWVLGEQSAKQLRGGNMQDVIFAGTESRKPQGFATVAITLDNSDHRLDIAFEEVTVARRLYRSGESEYLINGNACRLKDINELFYDTGIGKEGYSIIGQGQIDRILSGKAEERRELFDEAAGIVKFKRRKAASIKKLEEEKQNLLRLTDILSELSKQVGPLEKQSEIAKIYLKKKEELKNLDVNLFLVESDYQKEQMQKIEGALKTAEGDLQDSRNLFEKTKKEYEVLEKNLEDIEVAITEKRETSSSYMLKKQHLEGQIALAKEQIKAFEQNDAHYRERSKSIGDELEKRYKEKTYLDQVHQDLNEELNKILQEQEEEEKTIKKMEDKKSLLSENIEKLKNTLLDILNQRATTKGKMQRFDAMLEQIEIRKAAVGQQILTMRTQQETLEGKMQGEKDLFLQTEQILKEKKEKIEKKEQQISVLGMQIQRDLHKLESMQSAFHRESSRLESLINLTERYDGYGNSIKRLMEHKGKDPSILGVVADLIQVSKEYEVAVETALGGSIQNIVTKDEQAAKECIAFLKTNKYGRATFLPLTALSLKNTFSNQDALKEEGVVGLASSLVKVDKAYQVLAGHLLGKTLVVDTIDRAISIAKKYRHSFRMVTLEGDLLNPGGAMTGGAFKNSSNLLGRRREIEELQKRVESLRLDLEKIGEEAKENRQKRNLLRESLEEIQKEIQSLQIQKNTAKMGVDSARENLEKLQLSYEKLQTERNEIQAQLNDIEKNSVDILQEMESSRAEEEKLKEESDKGQEALENLQTLERKEQERMEQIRLEYANITQKAGFNEQNQRRLQEEIKSLQEELKKIEEDGKKSSGGSLDKEKEIESYQTGIENISQEIKKLEEEIKNLVESKSALSKEHKSFFEKRDQLSERMNLLDKECYRLNNQKEKIEDARESKITYLWEEYELTPQGAIGLRQEDLKDRGEMKKSIHLLREQIRSLGNVNVNAIEEYKEVSERHEFLSGQYEDLIKAEETLVGIIEELDAGMRKQFNEKFAQIQQEFDKAFKELFGGGKGSLVLDDTSEDILEAGISIISQPPGKKLQNMMQLSGGEKALTAIALLFAIQNLKPSPFCLLDEIEAALDDSNVVRYAGYLHKLTKNTQFIIITHRRGTMNAADRLYGITMQEKGVSTLVSVNLIENELEK